MKYLLIICFFSGVIGNTVHAQLIEQEDYYSLSIYMESFQTTHTLGGCMSPDSLRKKFDVYFKLEHPALTRKMIEFINKNINLDSAFTFPTVIYDDSKIIIDFKIHSTIYKTIVINDGEWLCIYDPKAKTQQSYSAHAFLKEFKKLFPLFDGYYPFDVY